MIDLFDLYGSFQSVYNVFQGGFWRLQTDYTRACNDISNDLWIKWTREAEKSQEARDRLLPYLRSKNLIVKSQNSYYGVVTPPSNYGRYATARIIVEGDNTYPAKDIENGECDGFKTEEEITDDFYEKMEELQVEIIDQQRWAACLQHETKKPTMKKPKMNEIDGGFRVAPRKISVIALDYYTRPEDATFIYDISMPNIQTGAGDQIIYNKKDSKPLQWDNTVRNEFIWRLGERFGAFTREQYLSTVSTQQKMAE